MTPWQSLVRRYCPPDQRVCNCGDAYETLHKNAGRRWVGEGYPMEIIDVWQCPYGCQSAQLTARDYIAGRIVEDINP